MSNRDTERGFAIEGYNVFYIKYTELFILFSIVKEVSYFYNIELTGGFFKGTRGVVDQIPSSSCYTA